MGEIKIDWEGTDESILKQMMDFYEKQGIITMNHNKSFEWEIMQIPVIPEECVKRFMEEVKEEETINKYYYLI